MVKKAASRWPRWLVQMVLGLVCAALVLGGVVAVSNVARDTLGPQDRYAVSFLAIECNAPAGMKPTDFLGEVQYNGPFPDTINILDATLAEKLRDAFARHPKVERVEKVSIRPPKQIRVDLVFRQGM